MFRMFNDLDSLKDVLEDLIEQKVTIILERGQRLTVEVDAVVDNLLVASIDGKILFIDIECICAVITCCEEILESLLGGKKRRREEEEKGCGRHEEERSRPISRKLFKKIGMEEEEESRKHDEFDF